MQYEKQQYADSVADQCPGIRQDEQLVIVLLRCKIDQGGASHEFGKHLQQCEAEDDQGYGSCAFSAKGVGVDNHHHEHNECGENTGEEGTENLICHCIKKGANVHKKTMALPTVQNFDGQQLRPAVTPRLQNIVKDAVNQYDEKNITNYLEGMKKSVFLRRLLRHQNGGCSSVG